MSGGRILAIWRTLLDSINTIFLWFLSIIVDSFWLIGDVIKVCHFCENCFILLRFLRALFRISFVGFLFVFSRQQPAYFLFCPFFFFICLLILVSPLFFFQFPCLLVPFVSVFLFSNFLDSFAVWILFSAFVDFFCLVLVFCFQRLSSLNLLRRKVCQFLDLLACWVVVVLFSHFLNIAWIFFLMLFVWFELLDSASLSVWIFLKRKLKGKERKGRQHVKERRLVWLSHWVVFSCCSVPFCIPFSFLSACFFISAFASVYVSVCLSAFWISSWSNLQLSFFLPILVSALLFVSLSLRMCSVGILFSCLYPFCFFVLPLQCHRLLCMFAGSNNNFKVRCNNFKVWTANTIVRCSL